MFARLVVDLRRDLTISEPLANWIEELAISPETSELAEADPFSWRSDRDASTVWA